MDLAARQIDRRRMDRSATARGARAASRPQLPADDPFYVPPPGFEHAKPGTVLRTRDVELAFLGLVPQKFTATQLLYRSTDLNGEPAGDRHDRGRARRTGRRAAPARSCPTSARSTRWRHAASRPTRCAAAPRPSGAGAVRVPADRRRARRGLGGVDSRPRGPARDLGRALRARLPRARRPARRAELRNDSTCRPTRRSDCGVTPAAASPPRGPPRCTPTTRPNSTSSAPCSAPRSAISVTPSAGSTARFFSGLPALVVAALSHVYPDLDRVITEHATDEGKAMLQASSG